MRARSVGACGAVVLASALMAGPASASAPDGMVLPTVNLHFPIQTGGPGAHWTCAWSITQRPPGAMFQIVGVRMSRPGVTAIARVTYVPTGAFVGKWVNPSNGSTSMYTGRHGVPATAPVSSLRVTVSSTVCQYVGP